MKTAYEHVLAARGKDRLTGLDFVNGLFTGFIELHGDRRFADDPAVVGGLAYLGEIPVTVLATEKGRDTKSRIKRNFGTPNPEGYRKALRLMKQAEKFRRPVICLVDTAGAFCGIGAEERGQGHAISENLAQMIALKTPVLSILIGEGGSGGALALAVADEVWMLENAVYSVISPEGCANILWRDTERAPDAAQYLKLTAEDVMETGAVDRVIQEDAAAPAVPTASAIPGVPTDPAAPAVSASLFERLSAEIAEWYEKASALSQDELTTRRYERFRRIGAE
jgi:acetyl-CoA carboxylase carboxyl transferase subunit alpha